jgi:hypothetical protein
MQTHSIRPEITKGKKGAYYHKVISFENQQEGTGLRPVLSCLEPIKPLFS